MWDISPILTKWTNICWLNYYYLYQFYYHHHNHNCLIVTTTNVIAANTIIVMTTTNIPTTTPTSIRVGLNILWVLGKIIDKDLIYFFR